MGGGVVFKVRTTQNSFGTIVARNLKGLLSLLTRLLDPI
jgi:hypothetical protein